MLEPCYRFLLPVAPLADLLKLLLICGKFTVGVLLFGPYNPKFLAAADFLSGFTLGKGLKTGPLGDFDKVPLSLEKLCDFDGVLSIFWVTSEMSLGSLLALSSNVSSLLCTIVTFAFSSSKTGSGECPSAFITVLSKLLSPLSTVGISCSMSSASLAAST